MTQSPPTSVAMLSRVLTIDMQLFISAAFRLLLMLENYLK